MSCGCRGVGRFPDGSGEAGCVADVAMCLLHSIDRRHAKILPDVTGRAPARRTSEPRYASLDACEAATLKPYSAAACTSYEGNDNTTSPVFPPLEMGRKSRLAVVSQTASACTARCTVVRSPCFRRFNHLVI